MSERTHAPRSGGRTTEQRSTAEARRRTGTAEPGKARGTRAGTEDAAESRSPRGARATTRGTAESGTVRGTRAATQGTAALKLDTATAEPLRVTDTAATAPRLRVAPPAPISAPRAPFIAAVIGLVIVGVLGILMINTKTNENSFEISRLQDQKAALDTQQQQLENQLARYDSVGNLDAAAKRLGLVKADAPAYIRLPDGKVIGVPRPGTGQPAVTAPDTDAAATGPNRTGTAPDRQGQQVQPGGRGQQVQPGGQVQQVQPGGQVQPENPAGTPGETITAGVGG